MYTLKQAAEKLDISVVTLRRYIKQGKLIAKKVGKEYRIAEEDIETLRDSAPANAEAMVKHALETNTDFRFGHQRADALRQAETLLRERGDTERADEVGKDALIFSYRLIVQATAEKRGLSNRGRFSPLAVLKDAEGRDIPSPDPALIDSSLVAHAKMRADEVKNPVTKAIYCDLVYEFSKNAERPIYGKRAAEAYLQAVEIEPADEESYNLFNVQSYVLRALELALALKDDDLFRAAITCGLRKMNRSASENKMRVLHELIEQFLKNAKKLDAATIDELARLIDVAVDFYFRQDKKEYLGREFIELKKLLPKVKASVEEQKKVQRQLFDSYIREGEAKSGSGLAAAHFYSEALKISGGVITSEEQAALRRRIEEANLQAENEMQVHSYTIDIKTEDIKQYVDAILVDDLEASLIRIALLPGMIPSLERAKQSAQELLKEFPMSQMLGRSLLQDGRVVTTTPGGIELTENHILNRLAEEISLHGMFLGFLFDELKGRGLDAKKLTAFLSERDFFKNNTLPAVGEALELYFDGKYFSAVTVLLPQLEQVLRLANRKLGLPTLRALDNGEQRVIYLQEALANLEDIFTPDQYQYFCLVLWDKRGPALRDSSAHGLLNYSGANKYQANLLLQLLLILATFEYRETNSEGA
jgi:excisionase family DNA binding protein